MRLTGQAAGEILLFEPFGKQSDIIVMSGLAFILRG